MSIIGHIEYLLQNHDCVIVPGIGALLAHSVPAYYDDNAERWCPPSRIVSFNPDLHRTDGLIASSVARRDGITMNAAAAKVRTEAERMRHSLEETRFLALGDAGSLRLTDDGRMLFTPGNIAWLSPSTMWLPELSLLRAQDDPAVMAGRSIAEEAERRRRSLRVRRIAAAAACAAVVICLGWILSNNISNIPSIQLASLMPTEKAVELPCDGIFTDSINMSPPAVVLAQEPAAMEPSAPAIAASPMLGDGRYVLVVGSLSSAEDAQKFINQHRDIQLGLLEVDGRYRVYAAASNNWNEAAAAAALPSIAEKFHQAWVCSR